MFRRGGVLNPSTLRDILRGAYDEWTFVQKFCVNVWWFVAFSTFHTPYTVLRTLTKIAKYWEKSLWTGLPFWRFFLDFDLFRFFCPNRLIWRPSTPLTIFSHHRFEIQIMRSAAPFPPRGAVCSLLLAGLTTSFAADVDRKLWKSSFCLAENFKGWSSVDQKNFKSYARARETLKVTPEKDRKKQKLSKKAAR